jgi:alkylhydroperoxidase/carboxymuconolactone decarboxylase family protein YurZ
MTQAQLAPWQVALQKSAPALLNDVSSVRESIMADGALSMKVKTLMTMICDALLAHSDGVAAIANRARSMGATEEEIAEAVGVAFLMGGLPALVTGASAFRE